MELPFAKYEGLGNDFLVVEARHCALEELTPARVAALCDRHRGVGGDGVLWLGPAASADAAARLVIFNADGSRPEMCGNGVRCVAASMVEEGARGPAFSVETDAGPREVEVARGDEEGLFSVRVGMGLVQVFGALEVAPWGLVVPADVGNPHAVLADPGDEASRERAVLAVRAHEAQWPQGVNVEFLRREGGRTRVRVCERGVGWTRACGTGACAVAAVEYVREGAAPARRAYEVWLEGGALRIELEPEGEALRAWMTGPARCVFRGRTRL